MLLINQLYLVRGYNYMLIFNKAHVFSNRPDSEISDDAPAPSFAAKEQEAKRLAMLASVQQSGGFELSECHQH
ncbi:hypothetical protein EDI28_02255 [Photobacterium chitinilyticum]|uniref:Uncharacterized protein n=2 Tax=Photobacterium chitinilyticum TaxID=2485123 RepID=A0A3S3R2S4_9GAMM|nr:hypothetical protein EDI28_02255 [Photobacterium chitinilyticum]